MNRRDDDNYGQVDGDASPPAAWGGVAYATAAGQQPWLRGSQPPWHLWGNSQTIEFPVETIAAPRSGITNQLIKISYKRPETWHWMFQARLIDGPPLNTPDFFTDIIVHWELIVGIGRSMQRMAFESSGSNFAIPPFEQYRFRWSAPDPFPRNAVIWTTQANAPGRFFGFDSPPSFSASTVNQIVAQDIQLQVQCVALTVEDNVAVAGRNLKVEVSAQFAPVVHVRPDWLHPTAPIEQQFPGDEIGGR